MRTRMWVGMINILFPILIVFYTCFRIFFIMTIHFIFITASKDLVYMHVHVYTVCTHSYINYIKSIYTVACLQFGVLTRWGEPK